MNVEKTLKDLNDYFINELIQGNFEVLDLDQYILEVLTYTGGKFYLWHCNQIDGFKCYEAKQNTIKLDFTERQKETLYVLTRGIYQQHKKDILTKEIAEKTQELNNLEA